MSNQHESSGSRGKAIATPPLPPPALNCPRCDSPNTKFCYFNNYSLSQPRHFCKACKRYWTRGGALRNVPIGGGCRKTKKANRSPSTGDSNEYSSGASSYSDMGRFKNYDGLDFQLRGGLTKFPSFNSISGTPNVGGQLVSSFGEIPTAPIASSAVSNFGLNLNSETNMSQFMAFNNLPLSYSSPSSILKQDHGENNINIGRFNEGLYPEIGPTNGNLASSMESFSSINQDLHWKLQQERTSMMLNGGVDNNYQQQNVIIGPTNQLESFAQAQKPQPMLFHNLEISSKPAGNSRKETNGINVNAATANFPTEWYFGNSGYAPAVNQFPSSNGNGKGIQGWANFDQYTSLP